jgi:hypothetical protein
MRVNVRVAALAALLCSGPVAASAPAAMPNCSFVHGEIMTALSNPKVPLEEYHEFFDKVHLPEVVERGIGFEGAQRFHVLASVGSAPWGYLSLYGLEPGNQIATTGVKFRPGAQPAAAPAPYLADGSVAWIFRRVTQPDDNAGRRVECAPGQKLFVVIPKAGAADIDVHATLTSVPGLFSAERYEFSKSTKGPAPGWRKMVVFRSSPDVFVPAALERLGAVVGCARGGACGQSSGAVWALEPLGNYITRPESARN